MGATRPERGRLLRRTLKVNCRAANPGCSRPFRRLRSICVCPEIENLQPLTSLVFRVMYASSRVLFGIGVRMNDVSVREQIQQRREEVLRVAAGHGAGNVRLFGSVARGEETPESDVDLLIDVTGETTPWFPASLIADLEQLLRRPVQVVIHRSLSPLIRDAVLRDAVPL
jgi:predicted nucleotidyltransferase